jgi:hypothetical protein
MVTITGDKEVQARALRVERFLRCVCGDDEFPWFVSDEATIHDICTLDDREIASRLLSAYGVAVEDEDLRRPIWVLVDRLEKLRTPPP